MGTITVRLDAADEQLLDQLVRTHGDRSTAVREAIRLLASNDARLRALDEALEAWEEEYGPIDQAGVDEYIRRYDL